MSETKKGDTDFDWRKHYDFLGKQLEKWERELKVAEILFVDDDPADCELFLIDSKKYRCKVTVCSDSVEASNLINSRHFDFVFIDQKMPKITGLEILQATLPRPATAFFLVTGNQDSNIADRALKLGAFYAPKDSLKETLEIFLHKK